MAIVLETSIERARIRAIRRVLVTNASGFDNAALQTDNDCMSAIVRP